MRRKERRRERGYLRESRENYLRGKGKRSLFKRK